VRGFFLAASLCVIAAAPAAAQTNVDLVSQSELRVCADPHNLPFSNDKREGFENKIAELVGRELKLPVTYTWFPDSQGFIRATILKNRCDVIIGTVAGVADLDTTQAYYHTGYMLVTNDDQHITTNRISDYSLIGKHIGLIAATPPTDLIVQHDLMDNVAIYQLVVDTRIDQPAHDMLTDLVAHRIGVGLLWGPYAGYYIKHDHLPLRAVFLDPEASKVRLDYHIAMGVRPASTDFRRRLNAVITKDMPQITAILQEYGIPLLDEQNKPITAPPATPG
jgi:quinoprotein dehydrogenase-associated probable ABC transporter substrate-binding protein